MAPEHHIPGNDPDMDYEKLINCNYYDDHSWHCAGIPSFANFYVGHCTRNNDFARLINSTKWWNVGIRYLEFLIHEYPPELSAEYQSSVESSTSHADWDPKVWSLDSAHTSTYMLHCDFRSPTNSRLIKAGSGMYRYDYLKGLGSEDLAMAVAHILLLMFLGTCAPMYSASSGRKSSR